MNPDLYGAWLTAGAWLAAHWTGLAAYGIGIAALTAVACALWPGSDDYRTRNDRRQAAWTVACEPRPEPDLPGVDDTLLAACQQILAATNNAREEKP